MKTKDFTVTLVSDKSPADVFNTIKNVREWWSGFYGEEFEGISENIDDEFIFRAGEGLHYSRQKLVEVIPNKKIVWLVTDSKLSFLKNQYEWTGTKIIFTITQKEDKTELVFTHEGLNPGIECFKDCSKGWSLYLQNTLLKLITTGGKKENKLEKVK